MRLALLVLLACLWAIPASATDYYVTKTGNNGNTCTQAETVGTAKLTIANFLSSCGPLGSGVFGAGDRLLIRTGTYTEAGMIDDDGGAAADNIPSGTAGNYVSFEAYPGNCDVNACEAVTFRPSGTSYGLWLTGSSYVEFDGVNLDFNAGGVTSQINMGSPSHHIRFKNLDMSGSNAASYCAIVCGGDQSEFLDLTIHDGTGQVANNCGTQCNNYGMYLSDDSNLVDRVEIYATSGAGIQIYNGSGGSADNNTIRNTTIHDITLAATCTVGSPQCDGDGGNRLWGIIVTGSGNTIYNVLIHDTGKVGDGNNAGIYVLSGSNHRIYNNTITGNVNIGILLQSGASNADIRNNISYNNSGGNYTDGGSGTSIATNLFTNPSFTDAGSDDYTIQSGSSARDAGTSTTRTGASLLAIVTTDIIQTPRPQGTTIDIGAYEFDEEAPEEPLEDIPDATGTIVITENFICSAGANITTVGFLKETGFTGDAVCTNDNKARSNSASGVNYYMTTPTVSTQYDVQEQWTVLTLIAGSYYGVTVRMASAVETFYQCYYDVSGQRINLRKVVNGTPGDLYTGAIGSTVFGIGATPVIAAKVRTARQSCEVDNVTKAYAEDTAITDQGHPGMTWYNETTPDSNTEGIKRDSIVVTDVDTAISGTAPTTFPTGIRVRTP